MSLTRINTFVAKPGQGDALHQHLASFVPLIRATAGCQSCQLLHSTDTPERIVVLEVWESREAHRASAANIPPEAIQQTMALLAGTPMGEYYTESAG